MSVRFIILVTVCVWVLTSAQSEKGSTGLFESDDILSIRLSGNMTRLFNDRSDNADYHSITLLYTDADGQEKVVPLKSKTRGNFRRKLGGCSFPPLWLNFQENKSEVKNSVFRGQNKIKLVTPCRGDQYVVYEYLVYKLYNLLTPYSFKARLVKVSYYDSLKNKNLGEYYGMLLESEEEMATRNHRKISEGKLVRPEATNRQVFLTMAVFEYMIGNTDWSVQYQQNVKLLTLDSVSRQMITVPYDFDQSGIVGAPYAAPAPELQMSSVRERRYRGFCIKNMTEFDTTFSMFNSLKEKFYEVYTNTTYVENNYVKSTTKFLDKFFETLYNPKKAERDFMYPCRKQGTGNVVIKGLK